MIKHITIIDIIYLKITQSKRHKSKTMSVEVNLNKLT